MTQERSYLCIDLKSFYASVECVDRGLDPLRARLVVADPERSEKTICLAVSPALKAYGVSGRARVFEIPPQLSYIMASPRMARYIERSADVYEVYLGWIAKEDIHVYSIDEAFFDITNYLSLYNMSARELGEAIRDDVYKTTGLPATCGLGPNLYLAKLALDITAKHVPDGFGELTLDSYQQTLWNHKPLTDFWRIGPGVSRRLGELGIKTMRGITQAPEELLYNEFGVDAEILIDHAWGVEPTTIDHIKQYEPQTKSFASAQVFSKPYTAGDASIVIAEMADTLALKLAAQGLAARAVNVWVGYEATQSEKPGLSAQFKEGRRPKLAALTDTATVRFVEPTNSPKAFKEAATDVFMRAVDSSRKLRRVGITALEMRPQDDAGVQLSLLVDRSEQLREQTQSKAVNSIRNKFGKNAMLKAIDLLPQATARKRNKQIGGHKSGD